MIDNLKNQEELEVKKLKVTKADIVVKGNVDKPYYVIVYHEVGKDYDNEGFGSYYLENVFKWREEFLEIVDENEQPQADHSGEVTEMVTNADRIRNMTDEELARFLELTEACGYNDGSITDFKNGHYMDMLKWLQAEVKEGNTNANT